MAPAARGQIVTFYSYKGGVGRTLALANVGVQLARWGYSVLCVDWDLEAPGLHLYFDDWLSHAPRRGLIDFIHDIAADERAQWREYLAALAPGPRGAHASIEGLHLLLAGSCDEAYREQLQNLDWPALYAERRLGLALERTRADWQNTYDFVLIDSRTGLTDIGGVCTVQMPDILVLLFTASRQSLDGVRRVAESAAEQRNELPVDRSRLMAVPVPSRFDTRVDYTESNSWLQRFAVELRDIYAEWLHKSVKVEEILEKLRLPYVPHWSYGEGLPILEETTRDPERLSYALETLAAVIAHRLGHSDLLVRNRDSFVAAARIPGVTAEGAIGPFPYDLFISAPAAYAQFTAALQNALLARGWRIFSGGSHLQPGSGWGSETEDALRGSQHLITLLGSEISATQTHETSEFLKAALMDPALERRLLPVQIGDVDPQAVPPQVRDINWLDARRLEADGAAEAISDRLGRHRGTPSLQPTVDVPELDTITVTEQVEFADDPAETHGPFVTTRGRHVLEVPASFRIARYLVTNEAFRAFVEAGGYEEDAFWPDTPRRSRRVFVCQDARTPGPATWHVGAAYDADQAAHPVAGVNYYEALAFVNWLNESHRDPEWRWVMPTEDMWELAARGFEGWTYPWGDEFKPHACNCAEEGLGTTSPVGRFADGRNPFGGFDFAGNVWEFTRAEDQPSWACVLRGGSFVNTSAEVKATLRLMSVPREHRPPDFGFRCAQVRRTAPA